MTVPETLFRLDTSRFRAAALVTMVATKTGSPYLKFARIEPCAAGGAFVVATNGAVLIAVRDPDGFCTEPVSVRVDANLIRTCKPNTSITGYSDGKIEITGKNGTVSLPDALDLEDEYINWRRVLSSMPIAPLDVLPAFDGRYLAALHQSANLVCGGGNISRPQRIYAKDSDSAALVFCENPDFLGVIMPIKWKFPSPAIPSWASGDASKRKNP